MTAILDEIPYIDRAFAGVVVKKQPFAAPVSVFLAFVFSASRQGHLWVEFKERKVFPALENIWQPSSIEMDLLLYEAAYRLSEAEWQSLGIHCKNGRFYLHRLFQAENRCFYEWERLRTASPLATLNEATFENELEALRSTKEVTEEQLEAIKAGCRSSLFILTGGPGTGKTFTAARFLRTLWRSLPHCAKDRYQIAVTAPTGKAALTLLASLTRTSDDSELSARLEAKTIHALLNIKKERPDRDQLRTLPYDLMIIDEASMIDVELMDLLLASIKSGAKVFMIGDPYQLPPVDGPAIFPAL